MHRLARTMREEIGRWSAAEAPPRLSRRDSTRVTQRCTAFLSQGNCLSSVFQRVQASSRARRFPSFASGFSPSRMNPWSSAHRTPPDRIFLAGNASSIPALSEWSRPPVRRSLRKSRKRDRRCSRPSLAHPAQFHRTSKLLSVSDSYLRIGRPNRAAPTKIRIPPGCRCPRGIFSA